MMKNLKFLLVVLATILIIPFGVFAEEETSKDEKVKVYLFYGNGCSYCAAAHEWFDEIEDGYGSKYELVEYEVWYDENNSELMTAVADVRKETADGVPYIIVGNQSWNGFSDDYKEEIISKIKSEYKQDPDERYDIMNYVDLNSSTNQAEDKDNTARDILVLLVLVGVVAGVSVGVYFARKQNN